MNMMRKNCEKTEIIPKISSKNRIVPNLGTIDNSSASLEYGVQVQSIANDLEELHAVADDVIKTGIKMDSTYRQLLNESDLSEMEDELLKTKRAARRAADSLYRYSSEPIELQIDGNDVVHREVDILESGIEAYSDSGLVYIRLPLLYSRKRVLRTSEMLSCIQAFADGVYQALNQCTNIDYAAFTHKTIIYLFSLPKDTRKNDTDNDNYDTTAVTNAVASIFPGGDGPLTCRMVYDSILDENLPTGTYITVVPEGADMPSNQKTVDFWRSKNAK